MEEKNLANAEAKAAEDEAKVSGASAGEKADAETANGSSDKADAESVKKADEKSEKKKKSKDSGAMAWIRDIVIALVIALVIVQFITPTIVQQHSMDNTLNNGDYLIMWKLPYKFGGSPDIGDIVVFETELETEEGDQKLLIKRVIAKGGDTVAIRDGIVYRNGEALSEPYTRDGYTNGGMDETVVPEGTLFLLGDNRVVSVDSRDPAVGFVSEDLLVGKAVLRLFPFNKIGGLYGNYPGDSQQDAA